MAMNNTDFKIALSVGKLLISTLSIRVENTIYMKEPNKVVQV